MKSKPISSYFDESVGVVVQVYATKKARKTEKTFQNLMGSVFMIGRKADSLRSFGYTPRMGQ